MRWIPILFPLLAFFVGSACDAEVLDSPPEKPDSDRHYLFYEHGKIVEGSDGRPVSPQFGPYEYREILESLSEKGFVVVSEIRVRDADVEAAAERLAGRVRRLLEAGVAPEHITLVGASKGGVITLRAANLLRQPTLRVAILAGMFESIVDRSIFWPHGAVLSVHDRADRGLAPERLLARAEGVTVSRVVVTELDLGHGLLYTPHPVWLDEVVEWSGISSRPDKALR